MGSVTPHGKFLSHTALLLKCFITIDYSQSKSKVAYKTEATGLRRIMRKFYSLAFLRTDRYPILHAINYLKLQNLKSSLHEIGHQHK
jgi:predicted nuclease of restriction endonuclease-like (RecB) superfamily